MRIRIGSALAGAAAGALMSCAGTAAPDPSHPVVESGIQGVTLVDQGCPVLRGSSPCPERPLSARVVVTKAESGVVVAQSRSDDRGRFRVGVVPGSYVLRAENLTGAAVPTAAPVPVHVVAGRFTAVSVHFDSGVRGPASR
jgi:hypothetical protein